MSGFLALVQTLVVLFIVIVLANIILKYLNTYMAGRNNIIKVIERVPVSKSSYIAIVKIVGIYYLMSFSDKQNEILMELDSSEVEGLIADTDESLKHYLEMGKKFGKKISFNTNDNDNSDRTSSRKSHGSRD